MQLLYRTRKCVLQFFSVLYTALLAVMIAAHERRLKRLDCRDDVLWQALNSRRMNGQSNHALTRALFKNTQRMDRCRRRIANLRRLADTRLRQAA